MIIRSDQGKRVFRRRPGTGNGHQGRGLRLATYPGLMRRLDLKAIFTSYAVAWIYLVGFVIAELVSAALSPHDLATFTTWASTSVHNLHHDPVGSLVASAFVTQGYGFAWPVLITLALFGANKVLGNWRTALVCLAGQVIGTLVSEGIVGYRVWRGSLPMSDRFLIDVGPSYVVVSAIVVALLYGSWLARAAAALDLALLVIVGNIFGGLSQLGVSAVGHLTALAVGVIGSIFLVWKLRRRLAPSENLADVGTSAGTGCLDSPNPDLPRARPDPTRPGPAPPNPPHRAGRVIATPVAPSFCCDEELAKHPERRPASPQPPIIVPSRADCPVGSSVWRPGNPIEPAGSAGMT
jgi:hypothetical protein